MLGPTLLGGSTHRGVSTKGLELFSSLARCWWDPEGQGTCRVIHCRQWVLVLHRVWGWCPT